MTYCLAIKVKEGLVAISYNMIYCRYKHYQEEKVFIEQKDKYSNVHNDKWFAIGQR